MKKNILCLPILLATLFVLSPTASWAAQASSDRTYRHTDLREVRRATVRVLENRDFRLIDRDPRRLTFVRKTGDGNKLFMTFSFHKKDNHRISVRSYGKSNGGHNKLSRKEIRRTTERLLDAIGRRIH